VECSTAFVARVAISYIGSLEVPVEGRPESEADLLEALHRRLTADAGSATEQDRRLVQVRRGEADEASDPVHGPGGRSWPNRP